MSGVAGSVQLLVLGGGGFLGRHIATAAVRAGHDVTVFSRAGTAPVDGVEALAGDRYDDLTALHGRTWDAVLDTFSDPDAVSATASLLSGPVGAYGYVSGMSVYHPAGPAVPGAGDPVRREGEATEDDPLQERSLAKLAAEAALAERFDGPTAILRVGVLVGPHDPTDRFTWWPVRLDRALAGDAERTVLAPGDPDRVVQYTDARDVAEFAVAVLDRRGEGVFDTVGPGRAQPLSAVLDACLRAAGGAPGDVDWVWAGERYLRENLRDVEEEQRPLWFPEDQIPQDAIDASGAIRQGLRFRPAEETARDVLAQLRAEGRTELTAGLDPDRERALVEGWVGV
ncbi:NAD-dependent epimerase/dehydratase family protein [Actinomycetospora callitridis]|uniref:NAD-dependent epimerase/dehydratase family protein n=1 Tax=Actinomycetospora callitridis TaxID=913944 RepID=UPI002366DC99|nr:NAD-dependent epimerase/dehydratase family protein [Actinomycetospora callitridis]MDD7916421.1 NAD-dependent epimerase/dehydratase family protein [Actinomycetospora callitridis]